MRVLMKEIGFVMTTKKWTALKFGQKSARRKNADRLYVKLYVYVEKVRHKVQSKTPSVRTSECGDVSPPLVYPRALIGGVYTRPSFFFDSVCIWCRDIDSVHVNDGFIVTNLWPIVYTKTDPSINNIAAPAAL